MSHKNQDGDFTSFGLGAVIALIILAVLIKGTGITVQGVIRYLIVPIYALLLVGCTVLIEKIRHGKDQDDEGK